MPAITVDNQVEIVQGALRQNLHLYADSGYTEAQKNWLEPISNSIFTGKTATDEKGNVVVRPLYSRDSDTKIIIRILRPGVYDARVYHNPEALGAYLRKVGRNDQFKEI